MQAHSVHLESSEAKVKKYFKVFYFLFAVTVAEVCIVYTPLPKMLIAAIVVLLACTKAASVGYYYMHLEHETKWLRMVSCLPLIAFVYAVFLVIDGPRRPSLPYFPEPARVYKGHPEVPEKGMGAVVDSEDAPPVQVFGNVGAAPSAESTTASPPPAAATPAAPAVGGSDEWK